MTGCCIHCRWWRWVRSISSSWIGFRTTARTRSAGRTRYDTTCRSMTVSSSCRADPTDPARAATGPSTRPAATCSTTAASCGVESASRCSGACMRRAVKLLRLQRQVVAPRLQAACRAGPQPVNCRTRHRPTRPVPRRVYSTRPDCADSTADYLWPMPPQRRACRLHESMTQRRARPLPLRPRWRRPSRKRRWAAASNNRLRSTTSSARAAATRRRQRWTVTQTRRPAEQPHPTTWSTSRTHHHSLDIVISQVPPPAYDRRRRHVTSRRLPPRCNFRFHRPHCRRRSPRYCLDVWAQNITRRRHSWVEWLPSWRERTSWQQASPCRPAQTAHRESVVVHVYRIRPRRRPSSRCRCHCRCTIDLLSVSNSSSIVDDWTLPAHRSVVCRSTNHHHHYHYHHSYWCTLAHRSSVISTSPYHVPPCCHSYLHEYSPASVLHLNMQLNSSYIWHFSFYYVSYS